jgi:hypothetical protein
MPGTKALKVVAGIVVSFAGLAGTIILLAATETIRFGVAMLMLVALVGMYVGFGVLVAIYRLISKLD